MLSEMPIHESKPLKMIYCFSVSSHDFLSSTEIIYCSIMLSNRKDKTQRRSTCLETFLTKARFKM